MADADPAQVHRRRARRRKAPDTNDPVEIAIAEVGGGSTVAERLLHDQRKLIAEEMRALRARRLLNYGWIALLAALALVAGVTMWAASRADGLIVEPFHVPPSFAERGFTEAVVAGQFLDKLTAIQKSTDQSARAVTSYDNNWSDNIQLAIPQAGVSAGELWRVLKAWLGNESRIRGELTNTAEGLGLTVRIAGRPAVKFTGSEAELETLLLKAAESIHAESQPYLYALYLDLNGRTAEAAKIFHRLARDSSAVERRWASIGLGSIYMRQGQPEKALVEFRRAAVLESGMPNVYAMAGYAYDALGHDERAAAAFSKAADLFPRADPREFNKANTADTDEYFRAQALILRGDFLAAIPLMEQALDFGSDQSTALALARLEIHEPGAALAALRQAREATPDDLNLRSNEAWFRLQIALALRDERAVRSGIARFERAVADDHGSGNVSPGLARLEQERGVRPHLAIAYATIGETDKAAELVRDLPLDCYLCLRAAGIVAEAQGRHAEADRWYFEMIRQGRSLPFGYLERGLFRARAGDWAAALPFFLVAHEKTRGFADPLKYWGDALAARRDWQGALKRYEMAAERAPRWGQLHIDWARALLAAGRTGEARAKLSAAAEMDLAPADRQRLRRMLTQ